MGCRGRGQFLPPPASAVVAVSCGRPATEVGRAPVDKLRYSEPVVAGGADVVRPHPLSVPPGAEFMQPDSWVCFPPHRVATASAVASSASISSDPVAVRSL